MQQISCVKVINQLVFLASHTSRSVICLRLFDCLELGKNSIYDPLRLLTTRFGSPKYSHLLLGGYSIPTFKV